MEYVTNQRAAFGPRDPSRPIREPEIFGAKKRRQGHTEETGSRPSPRMRRPKNRKWTQKSAPALEFLIFFTRKPLGTPSEPFSEGPRQIWGRKRKYGEGSNPAPLASQPHALTTGLPRLTHNKTGKINLLILQPERQSPGSLL